MMPSIVTIPAAARLLGMSDKTLWSWVHTLPQWQSCVSHKNGRRTYLSTARLRAAGHLMAPEPQRPDLQEAEWTAVLTELRDVGGRLERLTGTLLDMQKSKG